MTKHFIRKPFIIEAFLWTGEWPPTEEMPQWMEWVRVRSGLARTRDGALYEHNGEDWLYLCSPGSWVYKDPYTDELMALREDEMSRYFKEVRSDG